MKAGQAQRSTGKWSGGITRVGWLMLFVFVGVVAWQVGIGRNVHLFQWAYLIGFVGYALLVWQLWRGQVQGGWWIWFAGCILLRAVLLHTTPSDDLYRYLWEGRIQLAGYNPYALAPDADELVDLRDADWGGVNHPDYPAIYPPLAQMTFRLLAFVHPSLWTFKVAFVLVDILTIALLGAWLTRLGKPAHWAFVYALCPLTLTAFAIEGHLDSLMLALLAAVGICVADRRIWSAAVLLALAILAKLVPVLLLPWLIVRHRRAALLCVAVIVLGYLPYIDASRSLFESLTRFGGGTDVLGLGNGVLSILLGSFSARFVGAMVIGVTAVYLAWRCRSFDGCLLGSFSALILFMPVVHFWYVTWLVLASSVRRRWSWLVLSGAMVLYFEATAVLAERGEWLMPSWVPWVLYGLFAPIFCVEEIYHWRLRRRVHP